MFLVSVVEDIFTATVVVLGFKSHAILAVVVLAQANSFNYS